MYRFERCILAEGAIAARTLLLPTDTPLTARV
jgi:hypothetical protein